MSGNVHVIPASRAGTRKHKIGPQLVEFTYDGDKTMSVYINPTSIKSNDDVLSKAIHKYMTIRSAYNTCSSSLNVDELIGETDPRYGKCTITKRALQYLLTYLTDGILRETVSNMDADDLRVMVLLSKKLEIPHVSTLLTDNELMKKYR